MADLSPFHPDYGAPGEAPPPGAPPAQAAQSDPGLAQRWRDFLGDPASRAALISFGAQLAQPVAVGQNTMGHIGQAIGKAGEGATKAYAIEQKDIENESKQVLRESQANAATSRAQTAQANADTAAIRAQAYEAGVESRSQLNRAKAETEVQKQAKLDAEARFLEEKLRLYPDSEFYKQQLQAVQIERQQAAANYLSARADAIPQDVATRQQRANTAQQNADTQQMRARDQTVLDTQREERRGQQGAAKLEKDYVAEYERYKANTQKNNNDPMRKGEATPILPYAEWRKGYPSGQTAKPQEGQSTPAPRAPEPALRKAGVVYSNDQGQRALWTGSGWVLQ